MLIRDNNGDSDQITLSQFLYRFPNLDKTAKNPVAHTVTLFLLRKVYTSAESSKSQLFFTK